MAHGSRNTPLDLGLLIGSILGRLASNSAEKVCFRPAAVRALFGYKWPSNIRELENENAALTKAKNAESEENKKLREQIGRAHV